MMLHGERCLLRPWRMADAEALARHANNPNIACHLRDRFPHPYRLADAKQFLAHTARGTSGNAVSHNLAIDVAGEAAGGIGFTGGRDVERYSAEIGYWLSEAHW